MLIISNILSFNLMFAMNIFIWYYYLLFECVWMFYVCIWKPSTLFRACLDCLVCRYFLFANAAISFKQLVESYPGPLQMVFLKALKSKIGCHWANGLLATLLLLRSFTLKGLLFIVKRFRPTHAMSRFVSRSQLGCWAKGYQMILKEV